MAYTVSAPRKSGYRNTFDSFLDAREAVERLMGMDMDEMFMYECNGTRYYYGSEADCNSDQDGAYATKIIEG